MVAAQMVSGQQLDDLDDNIERQLEQELEIAKRPQHQKMKLDCHQP
jgi:hypothetical protein